LQWYADGMYPPMILDEELNADGTVKKAGQQYYMKPMNCPFHNLFTNPVDVHIANSLSDSLNLERSIVTRNQAFFTESHELVALHRMMPTFIAPKSRWWGS